MTLGGRGRIASIAGVLALALATSSVADAQNARTSFLTERLRSDDVRVRTQAALALGGTDDDGAVAPLCGALKDDAELVRQASAAALKRLARPASAGCLRARLLVERNPLVKTAISRALEGMGPGDGPSDETPRNVPGAKYYVSVSPVTNNTGRPQPEIDRIVAAAIRQKLDALGTFQLAPAKETPDVARAVMARRKLKGFYLAVAVDPFKYDDGNLRVRVKVAVFTYPGKDLRGEVPAGVTQTGVRAGDHASEDNLMGLAASCAAELFAQNFQ